MPDRRRHYGYTYRVLRTANEAAAIDLVAHAEQVVHERMDAAVGPSPERRAEWTYWRPSTTRNGEMERTSADDFRWTERRYTATQVTDA